MQKGYKCDWCFSFNILSEIIEAHENICPFNPENKLCHSCSKRAELGAPISGVYFACMDKHDSEKVLDCEAPCKYWKPIAPPTLFKEK